MVKSQDPVMKLLVESEVYDYCFILYLFGIYLEWTYLLLVFIYLIGIPTFILYSAIGMLSSPLSVLIAVKSPEKGPDLFASGPVVQYIDVDSF